jgi:hypothetical protein
LLYKPRFKALIKYPAGALRGRQPLHGGCWKTALSKPEVCGGGLEAGGLAPLLLFYSALPYGRFVIFGQKNTRTRQKKSRLFSEYRIYRVVIGFSAKDKSERRS